MRKNAATLIAGSIVVAASLSCCGKVPDASSPSNDSAITRSSPGPDFRTVQFSGYEWKVKSSEGRVGPGPNYFSDSLDNVTVDGQGQLHLRITKRNGRWFCAEVISRLSFGYGTYRFYLRSAVNNLNPQVVLGMFTWDDDPAYNHREIDIEMSRWGHASNKDAQFVLQPYTKARNIVRFSISTALQTTTHSFTWKPESVFCQSLAGHYDAPPEPGFIIQQHLFTQGVPRPGEENARINLWLMVGAPPSDGKEQEVIISKFEFVKLQ